MTQVKEGAFFTPAKLGKTAKTAQDFATLRSGCFEQRPHPWLEFRGAKVSPDSILSGSHEPYLSNGFVSSTGQKPARGPCAESMSMEGHLYAHLRHS